MQQAIFIMDFGNTSNKKGKQSERICGLLLRHKRLCRISGDSLIVPTMNIMFIFPHQKHNSEHLYLYDFNILPESQKVITKQEHLPQSLQRKIKFVFPFDSISRDLGFLFLPTLPPSIFQIPFVLILLMVWIPLRGFPASIHNRINIFYYADQNENVNTTQLTRSVHQEAQNTTF